MIVLGAKEEHLYCVLAGMSLNCLSLVTSGRAGGFGSVEAGAMD